MLDNKSMRADCFRVHRCPSPLPLTTGIVTYRLTNTRLPGLETAPFQASLPRPITVRKYPDGTLSPHLQSVPGKRVENGKIILLMKSR
jgi:hypothetical protein